MRLSAPSPAKTQSLVQSAATPMVETVAAIMEAEAMVVAVAALGLADKVMAEAEAIGWSG